MGFSGSNFDCNLCVEKETCIGGCKGKRYRQIKMTNEEMRLYDIRMTVFKRGYCTKYPRTTVNQGKDSGSSVESNYEQSDSRMGWS